MDVLGALASSTQIVVLCAEATSKIAQWYESVRTVDQRIDSFKREIETLRNTYDVLQKSLREPSMAEAARATDKELGGILWQQMHRTLRDCSNTVAEVNAILDKIGASHRLLHGPVMKQLRESLHTGQLARLRERIIIFGSGLQLPMQMLQLRVTLSQQQVTAENQVMLTDRITRLGKSIDKILDLVRQSPRPDTLEGLTLTRQTTSDSTWLKNMESYMGTAKKFLDRSSAAASSMSVSAVQHDDESLGGRPHPVSRAFTWALLTQTKNGVVESFIEGLPDDRLTNVPSESQNPTGIRPNTQDPTEGNDKDDDSQIDLILTKASLRRGLSCVDSGDYASAACHYQIALAKVQRNDFADKLAHDCADITLMLSECHIREEKYDDAIALLEPLSPPLLVTADVTSSDSATLPSGSNTNVDRRQALSASHMLAHIYLQTSDLEKAEIRSQQAFKGRWRVLGPRHPKFAESVNLVIAVYLAKGQSEEAEAYKDFLDNSMGALTPDASPHVLQPQTPSTPASLPRSAVLGTHPPHGRLMDFEADDLASELSQMRVNGDANLPDTNQQPSRQTTNTSETAVSKVPGVTLEEKFDAIRDLCSRQKQSRAAELGLALLREYDPLQKILLTRTDAIRKNIGSRSNKRGLAGTGHGFSALHFFCSLKEEATEEVAILLKHSVDVNAVAGRAGYRDLQLITPIDLAVQHGHENIVRLLLEHNAQCPDPRPRAGSRATGSSGVLHPLLVAVQSGHVSIVDLLLKHNKVLLEEEFPSRVWHGNSLLHEASFRCDIPMVQYLITVERSNDARGNKWYSFIGRPGQQDAFGITPIMFAVDMRDVSDSKLSHHKRDTREECLKTLLESTGGSKTGAPTMRTARDIAEDLFIQDMRGHNVWWYADKPTACDPTLRQYLDQMSSRSRLIEM